MAINKRIIDKIADKAADYQTEQGILKVLEGVEEGHQGKRLIDKLIQTI